MTSPRASLGTRIPTKHEQVAKELSKSTASPDDRQQKYACRFFDRPCLIVIAAPLPLTAPELLCILEADKKIEVAFDA